MLLSSPRTPSVCHSSLILEVTELYEQGNLLGAIYQLNEASRKCSNEQCDDTNILLKALEKKLTLELGDLKRKEGNGEGAIKLYDSCLGMNSHLSVDREMNFHCLVNQAVLLATQFPENALVKCEKAIAIKPKDFRAIYNKAGILMSMQKFHLALAAYVAANEAKPCSSSLHGIIDCYITLKSFDLALHYAKDLMELENVEGRVKLAEIYIATREFSIAEELCVEALAIDEFSKSAISLLAFSRVEAARSLNSKELCLERLLSAQTLLTDSLQLFPTDETLLAMQLVVQENITNAAAPAQVPTYLYLEENQEGCETSEDSSSKYYTYDHLKFPGPFPQSIDSTKRETYLSEHDFRQVFKMDKSTFSALQNWKKVSLKKQLGLF